MSAPGKRTVTREEVHETLWGLAAEYTGKSREKLTAQDRLIHDLGMDSLAVVELSMAVEEKLDLTLPEEMWEAADLTLGQVEEALWAQVQQP